MINKEHVFYIVYIDSLNILDLIYSLIVHLFEIKFLKLLHKYFKLQTIF